MEVGGQYSNLNFLASPSTFLHQTTTRKPRISLLLRENLGARKSEEGIG